MGMMRKSVDVTSDGMYAVFHLLPKWVTVWVCWMITCVFLGFTTLPDPAGVVGFIGMVLGVMGNVAMLCTWHGLSRAMGAPHFLGFPFSIAYLIIRLSGSDMFGKDHGPITFDNNAWLCIWAYLYVVTFIICLLFDIGDIIRWLNGDRGIVRSKAAEQRSGKGYTAKLPNESEGSAKAAAKGTRSPTSLADSSPV